MVKLHFSLSERQRSTGLNELYARVSVKRGAVFRLKTGLLIPVSRWDQKKELLQIPRVRVKGLEELVTLNKQIEDLKAYLISAILTSQTAITKEWLLEEVNGFLNNAENGMRCQKVETLSDGEKNFEELFKLYVKTQVKTTNRKSQFNTLLGKLQRYSKFRGPSFELNVHTMTDIDLVKFEEFMRLEHTFFDNDGNCIKHSNIYKDINLKRKPQQLGTNGIHYSMKRYRSFYKWAVNTKRTKNDPFLIYKLPGCVYGTPFFITTEERNRLYECDFSDRPILATQRDIFVFQSDTGCRTCDLYQLTKSNIVDFSLQYIPSKTVDKHAETVVVPLIPQALEIIERYADKTRSTLFPFISTQHYNKYIKEMLKLAGIDRIITILNPLTRKNEQHPIYEVASSYMARRDFIGNLYSEVQDPNLISSMTGHSEGSQAFSRYRAITNDLKRKVVEKLE